MSLLCTSQNSLPNRMARLHLSPPRCFSPLTISLSWLGLVRRRPNCTGQSRRVGSHAHCHWRLQWACERHAISWSRWRRSRWLGQIPCGRPSKNDESLHGQWCRLRVAMRYARSRCTQPSMQLFHSTLSAQMAQFRLFLLPRYSRLTWPRGTELPSGSSFLSKASCSATLSQAHCSGCVRCSRSHKSWHKLGHLRLGRKDQLVNHLLRLREMQAFQVWPDWCGLAPPCLTSLRN